MVKVRAIRSFCIGHGHDVAVGEVFEAEPGTANAWVHIGHVEVVKEEALPPPPLAEAESSDESKADESKADESSDEKKDSAVHPEQKADEVAGETSKPANREPRGRNR